MPRRFRRDWTQDEWNRYFKNGTEPSKYTGDSPVYQELSEKYGWKKETPKKVNIQNQSRWEGMLSESVHMTVRHVGNGQLHILIANTKTEYTSSNVIDVGQADSYINSEFQKSWET